VPSRVGEAEKKVLWGGGRGKWDAQERRVDEKRGRIKKRERRRGEAWVNGICVEFEPNQKMGRKGKNTLCEKSRKVVFKEKKNAGTGASGPRE